MKGTEVVWEPWGKTTDNTVAVGKDKRAKT